MKKYFFSLILLLALNACMKGISVDTIIHNARVHTMDEKNTIAEAMAVRDGKIIEVGPERQIMNKYSAGEYIDAGKKDVFPGFTDAHGHIMSYARQKLSVNLVGCRSLKEMAVLTEKYSQVKERSFIAGRGWDQSLWAGKEAPDNALLNELFPDVPVLLHRIDGHAAIANRKALSLAGITAATKVEGGAVELKDGKCTGLLLDNAVTLVSEKLPDFSEAELIPVVQEIQTELLQYGITGVHEAGVSQKEYRFLRKMALTGKLDIELYIMLMASPENMAFAKKNGKIKEKNIIVRSFKVMGDGALGSHGALLKKPYHDHAGNYGLLTTSKEQMNAVAKLAESVGYQVNIHAIGDSTNRIVLDLITGVRSRNTDHRWRIEHAQVIDPADFGLFAASGAFPSVQPTHAVTDQRWAADRLGTERLKGAYAYKTLLQQYGMLALGTDFPVEQTDPFLTIHAGVNRTNADGDPIGGFLPEEALTVEQCLRGITIWPAFACFQEERTGSLEKGKEATFVILAFPFQVKEQFEANFAYKVFIRGKEKYSSE